MTLQPYNTLCMATLTAAQCTPSILSSLVDAGMKAVRINSAHTTPVELPALVETIRSHAPGIIILIDTKGPEIRTNANICDEDITLSPGDSVVIGESHLPCEPGLIRTSVVGFADQLAPGVSLIIDDGAILLSMTSPSSATVIRGGILGSRKTISLSGAEPPALPAVSNRDLAAITAAVDAGVEIIAHSFVRSAADVDAVKKITLGSNTKVYAKIECRPAVDNLDSILAAADGLLVARGDLGANIDITLIPAVQMRCARLCADAGKPMIIATQILASTLKSESPLRAELSDIALGVLQHAQYLLLTSETAQSDNPDIPVKILCDTVKNTQLELCRI